jgi:hypothetical protein
LYAIYLTFTQTASCGFGWEGGSEMVEFVKPIIFDNTVFIQYVNFKKIFCEIRITDNPFSLYNERFFRLENILSGKTIQRKIGKTTFFVTKSFSNTASETVENMLVRYVAGQISNTAKYI